MSARRDWTVSIEESSIGAQRWAVIITRSGALIERSLWDRYETQAAATLGAKAAERHLTEADQGNLEARVGLAAHALEAELRRLGVIGMDNSYVGPDADGLLVDQALDVRALARLVLEA